MIKKAQDEERRRFLRLPLGIKVSFKMLAEEGRIETTGLKPTKARDLSAGGILFRSVRKIASGQVLQMKLHFVRSGKARDLAAIAKVVRCHKANQGYDVGVQFLQIFYEDLLVLEDFIEREAVKKTR
jgi:c-di-GMP-binding flagellar brake protein YcgR